MAILVTSLSLINFSSKMVFGKGEFSQLVNICIFVPFDTVNSHFRVDRDLNEMSLCVIFRYFNFLHTLENLMEVKKGAWRSNLRKRTLILKS